MLPILIMLSNYFHDFAVAVFTLVVAGRSALWKYAARSGPEVLPVVEAMDRFAVRVTNGSLVALAVLGAVRGLTFMDYEWNPAVGRGQIPALGVKHVVLVTLLLWSFVTALRHRAAARGRVVSALAAPAPELAP